ncbi:MAG TPA: CocE/NonD family hydrolase [Blastocatellia bacterium]|nr:CocE/NonD family hydrolase [Blastocatellia bacterium]
MSKLFCLLIAAAMVVIPCSITSTQAQTEILVKTSTHFIQVPAGTSPQSPGNISLAATLYQPRFLAAGPAVIYIHGFGGRRLTGDDNLAAYIAAAGYTVLSYTARGFGEGESGGRVTIAGPDEINDLKQVIDWLMDDPDDVISPRVTRIGVVGGSYGGGHSLQIASDPRVAAVVPLIGWTDLEQALYPNGVINYKLGIGQFYSGLERGTGSAPFYNYDRLLFEMLDMGAEGRALSQEVKQALAARSVAERGPDGRLVLKGSRQPTAPIFIIQSWDDYLFPSTQVTDIFDQITETKQIYMGRTGHPPGGHEFAAEEAYIGAEALRWFDHHLRGIGGRDSENVASAPAPFTGLVDTMRDFPSDRLNFYLKAGGTLSRKKKKGNEGQESAGGIFHRNRIRSSRLGAELPTQSDMLSGSVESVSPLPRRLVYTSIPLDSDVEMLGASDLSLFVSSNTSADFDLIVRMYDVAPDGTESEVTVGATRVTGLGTGEVRRVKFRDFGDHWIFGRGHSIRLKVTNIDFPDFRPPGANDERVSEFTIHNSRAFLSSIKIPVRKR